MANVIVVKRLSNGDVINDSVQSIIKWQTFSEEYLSRRFGLSIGEILKICRENGDTQYPPGSIVPFIADESGKFWTLRGGCSYTLFATGDVEVPASSRYSSEKGKATMEVTDLSDDSDDDDELQVLSPPSNSVPSLEKDFPHVQLPPQVEDGVSGEGSPNQEAIRDPTEEEIFQQLEEPQEIAPEEKGDDTLKNYRISALQALLAVRGHSELYRFVKRNLFATRQVRCLPSRYNGDIIFELPPMEGGAKGDRVRSMERSKDCYYWTRTITTSALVPKRDGKEMWSFGKMACTGALECRNNVCDYFLLNGSRNASAWSGQYKMSTVHQVDCPVEEGGLLCSFCNERPHCTASCPASMFYMYPSLKVSEHNDLDHMSRLAIHQGIHVHPERKVFSRESVDRAGVLLEKHHSSNPTATPSKLKNVTIGDVLAQYQDASIAGLSKDDENELWETLQVISTPRNFMSLLRSVRKDSKDWKGNGMFDSLRKMQENVLFPYIQRYRVPGQGSETDFPFIFKMSVKGKGSGVDILRRMRPGENLFGTWVMYDVMRRITTGWLTFAAHVYDHHYRALCTIFTCELMAEDATSLEIAWRQMIDVARQYGVTEIHIHGFMADNAIAGWNAVRNVFFGGVRDPDRERSDAFHWAQSIHRHTKECIIDGSRGEHIVMWKRLRDAKNVVEAYKIAQDITAWWKKGNAYRDKLHLLQGWMAWWVVRWTQWGNYIRLNLTATESALMPNSTGAESVHSSMRKCHPQKMIGLLEACEMDQNRAAAQIAAYTAYLNGANRGRGPTLFELAFRAADVVGTPSKFIEATNLWIGSSPQYDLCRTGPLTGDVRTRSQKRKGNASADITPEDSHRHDTVLLTTPNTRGFQRRNLHATDFETMPSDHGRASSVDNAERRTHETPVPRRLTRSRRVPQSAPAVIHHTPIHEIDVPRGTWHLRRTAAGRHPGPQCNGTCQGRTQRVDCRNLIKMVGQKSDNGSVVGIAFDGFSSFRGVAIPAMLWFCPNNLCHRSPPRKSVSGLSPVPPILQVQRETNLTTSEIEFLTSTGLDFVGRPPMMGGFQPQASFLRIDVDSYPEHINMEDNTNRLQFRNQKRIRQRNSITGEHLKRIIRAENEEMRVIAERDVTEGNAFGKQLCVRSHESEENRETREYWVQICCFPTCSCDDYWLHHWYKQSFILCKHLYWVFKNVFNLNIRTNIVIIQPVLTVGELKLVLERETDMD